MEDLNNWNFISAAYMAVLVGLGSYIGWAALEYRRLEKILMTLQEHNPVEKQ